MLKLQAGAFFEAIAITAMMQAMMSEASTTGREDWDPKEIIGADRQFGKYVRQLKLHIETIGAKFTLLSINRLLERIEQRKCTAEDLLTSIQSVHGRLHDELDGACIYVFPSESAQYLNDAEPLFGDDVAKSFPSASYDIGEAGKCLGFRRSTACVTHLMRVLEVALTVLANKFEISAAHTNWHNIIDQLESKIANMDRVHHGSEWKDDQAFYAGGAVHFRMLKDGWRNYAMHVRAKYTEEQAEEIYRSARAFMRHLSRRLSEQEAA